MAGRKKSARKRRKRKLIVFVIEIAVLAVVIAGFYFYNKLNMINRQELDQSKVAVGDVSEETEDTPLLRFSVWITGRLVFILPETAI